jgi:hypothetical protein
MNIAMILEMAAGTGRLQCRALQTELGRGRA